MAGGFRSLLAFWIGGAHGSIGVRRILGMGWLRMFLRSWVSGDRVLARSDGTGVIFARSSGAGVAGMRSASANEAIIRRSESDDTIISGVG